MACYIVFLFLTYILRSKASLLDAADENLLDHSSVPADLLSSCLPYECQYSNITASSNLAAIEWQTLRLSRACSCHAFCSFYGDCCSDSLAFSRQAVEAVLRLPDFNHPTTQKLRDKLQPSCRELAIGPLSFDDNSSARFVFVQRALAECDSCFVEDITDYFGSNSTEITQRLPVYYEGLGIIFPNEKCARCFEKEDGFELERVKPLPLAVRCNASFDNQTAETFCQYALNLTAMQTNKLALCVPFVTDVYMEQAHFCESFNMTENKTFRQCPPDRPVTELIYGQIASEIYRRCDLTPAEHCDNAGLLQLDLGSGTSPAKKCVKKGDVVTSTQGHALNDAQSFIHRMQRSDFSYRYMFDLFKLAAAEEARESFAMGCSSGRKEIYIERWRVCVRRNAGDITIGIEPSYLYHTLPEAQPPRIGDQSNIEWLDFSSSFFLIRKEQTNNGTSTILTPSGGIDPDFPGLETRCFRFNFITEKFHVSHQCLCEIFQKSNAGLPPSLSSLPRNDDFLSAVGSLSIFISLICLFGVLAVFSAFPKLRNRPTKLVMLLSAFLAIGMMMVLVNIYANVAIVRPRHQQEPTYEEDCLRSPLWKEIACDFIGTLLHFSYLATFCLSSALYIDLWYSVKQSSVPGAQKESNKRFYLLAGISCAIPLVIVLTAVTIDQTWPNAEIAPRYAEHVCWISEPWALLAFFVVPVVIALTVDIVFFVLIARQIRQNTFKASSIVEHGAASSSKNDDAEAKKKRREEKRKKYIRRLGIYAKMASMMGLTWLLGCIAPFIPDHLGFGLVLWYGFVVLNGLQGLFIFYTYVMNKKTLQVVRETFTLDNNSSSGNARSQNNARAPVVASTKKQHETAKKSKSDTEAILTK